MNLGTKFDLKDIALVPEPICRFTSRKEVKARNGFFLPVINAPMYSVVHDLKYNPDIDDLLASSIHTCLPRGFDYDAAPYYYRHLNRIWRAYSLEECYQFLNTSINDFLYHRGNRILLDVANGHMQQVLDIVKQLKIKFGNKIVLMVGNIANPDTFKLLSEAGADYIRCSIGSGNVCLTATSTAIYYPTGSLVHECYELKKIYGLQAKIVADGGIGSYSDIVKCLALGADLVMIGKILAQSLESDNVPYLWKTFKIKNIKYATWLFEHGFQLYKRHYGMSTKEAQKQMGGKVLKTAEGTTRWYRVEYKFKTWVDNLEDYLRSAMSYCNAQNLEEFKDSNFVLLTNSSIQKINK